MIDYKQIPYWTNKHRLELLREFRNYVNSYFANSNCAIENDTAKQARQRINMNLDSVFKIISCAGVPTAFNYTPAPITGHPIMNIDLLYNIFRLRQHEIPQNLVLDCLDQAIGIYDRNRRPSLFRSLNPIFWINKILIAIVGIPFRFLGALGFDEEKAESSFWGRIAKGVIYIVSALGSLVTILEFLNLLDPIRSFIRGII